MDELVEIIRGAQEGVSRGLAGAFLNSIIMNMNYN